MSEPFLGQIMTVPYNFAPRGWAFCDGQVLPISQNTAVFSLLGTTYGGNGESNFALPDLRGRVPVHAGGDQPGPGLEPYVLGETGGEEAHTLELAESAAHTHTVAPLASDGERTTDRPDGAYPSTGGIYASSPDAAAPMGSTLTASVGGAAHTNLMPYLTLSYVIALQGIFPTRS